MFNQLINTWQLRLPLHTLLGALFLCLNCAPSIAAPKVLASIKPIHSLVAGVMNGVAQPMLLIEGTTSPHDFSLRPSQAVALQNADLVFWVGPALESSLAKALNSMTAGKAVVPLLENKSLVLHALRHHDDFKGAHTNHQHGGKPGASIDPHIWLDPHNAIVLLKQIASELGKADPANAGRYQNNAESMQHKLNGLIEQVGDRMRSLSNKKVLVLHDAYQYFEKRFGLQVAGAVYLDPEMPVSAQRIRTLRRQIHTEDIVCVFSEPQYNARRVAAIIEGTSVRQGVFDPMGARIDAGPDHYATLIRALADAVNHCLGD